ncbi:MAG: acetamidase/formamidase family protein, partial [Candidatus Hydrothermarchaeota archaeon]
KVGDAIAIKIERLRMLSMASASGTDRRRDGYYVGDPFIAKRCPSCGEINPKSYVEGIGRDAVKCAKCNLPIRAFEILCGYTALFSSDRKIGVIVPGKTAASIAMEADRYAAPPKTRKAHSVLRLALADMPPGIVMRLRPSIGNIGTIPAIDIPSSHNCGDLGQLLVGAPHAYGMRQEDLALRTDAHMDLPAVREGTTVIAPVKVEGGGIYMGDINAVAGGGLVAGHTLDVSGEISVEVKVIKGLEMEGPIILPNEEDLPFLSRPFKK